MDILFSFAGVIRHTDVIQTKATYSKDLSDDDAVLIMAYLYVVDRATVSYLCPTFLSRVSTVCIHSAILVQDICLSVCLSHAGIVSKRMYLSSTTLCTIWYGHYLFFLSTIAVIKFQKLPHRQR